MGSHKSFLSGYVKIHRKITEWEWYSDPVTRDVFIHLLLIANWKDGKFQGVDIPRGSAVVSIKKLAEQLGFSYQRTRTAIEHLISTDEITSNGYSKFTVITVKNYETYQGDNEEDNEHLTSNQRTDNEHLTTIEESKKERRKESKNNNTSLCSEPKDSEPEADVELIPLNDGSAWRPTMTLYAEYVRLYPNVDVKQQFRAMRAWCLANPTKKKTKKGIKKFVNGWLGREQNKSRSTNKTTQMLQDTGQTVYDLEEIEKVLVNKV